MGVKIKRNKDGSESNPREIKKARALNPGGIMQAVESDPTGIRNARAANPEGITKA